jgi:hypothetical protein
VAGALDVPLRHFAFDESLAEQDRDDPRSPSVDKGEPGDTDGQNSRDQATGPEQAHLEPATRPSEAPDEPLGETVRLTVARAEAPSAPADACLHRVPGVLVRHPSSAEPGVAEVDSIEKEPAVVPLHRLSRQSSASGETGERRPITPAERVHDQHQTRVADRRINRVSSTGDHRGSNRADALEAMARPSVQHVAAGTAPWSAPFVHATTSGAAV